jgi:hypothetical protein
VTTLEERHVQSFWIRKPPADIDVAECAAAGARYAVDAGVDDVAPDVRAVTAAFVSNAVRHSGGASVLVSITGRWSRRHSCLQVWVIDEGRGGYRPTPARSGGLINNRGRGCAMEPRAVGGLALVDRLAPEWGTGFTSAAMAESWDVATRGEAWVAHVRRHGGYLDQSWAAAIWRWQEGEPAPAGDVGL